MEITQDVTQALKDTENSLRDFIAVVLRAKLGEAWVKNSGVSPERLKNWKDRRDIEAKRQEAGAVEQRLIYYADFYDLRTILKKHWQGEFSGALGEWKNMEVWLSVLEMLRDPDAHRRELLPHQKHLILGIAGEIRTRLVRYRSKKETSEDYYPRIESVKDNFGTVYTYGDLIKQTTVRLRVGDVLEFVITATDPLGESLQYGCMSPLLPWQASNIISVKLTEHDVRKNFEVMIVVRSMRRFHAYPDPSGDWNHDDHIIFHYEVLPPK